MKKIIIESELFKQFPDFKRGIIAVSEIKNGTSNSTIEQLLSQQIEKNVGTDYSTHEFIKAWDDVHRKFGSNPNKYPPSIKSLTKRIQKGGTLPFINSVVALFNYVSIKYAIPCGGDDVDRIEGNLHLGFAKGNEIFRALGSEENECPEAGEVIYYDDKTMNVMCRRWNWRNGDFTKITELSGRIVINIDGIGPIAKSHILAARDELAALLVEQCSAKVTVDCLDTDNREVETYL
jgi:DNA/RNA-binding domain of Phe-tRNA-synthetase-like protein